jgi:hypothetical protein
VSDESIKRLVELSVNAAPAIAELKKLNDQTKAQTDAIDALQKQFSELGQKITEGLSLAGVYEGITRVIDHFHELVTSIAEMNDKAQQLSISTDALQELQYAASQTGMPVEKLQQGLATLAEKAAKMDNATDAASNILRSFGVNSADPTNVILNKLADGFAHATDGTTKTAFAMELLGAKVGPSWVKFLNQGADGIAYMSQEAHTLGVVLDQETVKSVAEFNDNLTRLGALSQASSAMILKGLVEPLVTLSTMLVENIKNLGTFMGIVQTLQDAIFGTDRERFAIKAANDMMAANDALKDYSELAAKAAKDDYWKASADNAKKTLDALNAQAASSKKVYDTLLATQKAATAAPARPEQTTTLDRNLLKTVTPTKQETDDWTKWTESLEKSGEQTALLPLKIAYLTDSLDQLQKAGKGASLAATTFQDALDKLRPDPVAIAIKKMVDEALKANLIPTSIEEVTAAMNELEAAGLQNSEGMKKLYAQYLSFKSAAGDAAATVDLELNKMRDDADKNAKIQEEVWKRITDGSLTAAEGIKILNNHMDDHLKEVDKVKEKEDEWAKGLVELAVHFSEDFANKLIDDMGSVRTSFSQMLADLLKQIAKFMISSEVKNLTEMLSKQADSSGGWSNLISSWLHGSAAGNAWSGPGVLAMARGGILGAPTFFNAGGGTLGVAGEAGPEAVVPLQRTASGDLGVAAAPVTVNVYNSAGADVTQKVRDNSDGSRAIDIYVERKVQEVMSNGSMDRTMRSSYGLTRQPSLG